MEKITMFPSVTKTDKPHYVSLETALERIIKGNSLSIIKEIREGNKEKKKKLPITLFSGVFKGRKDEDIFGHSSLIVLDFDHIDSDSSKALLSTEGPVGYHLLVMVLKY